MRRRLLLLTAVTSLLVLIVLGIAVLPLLPSKVTEDLDSHMRGQIIAVANFIFSENPSDDQMRKFLASIDTVPGTTLGVRTATGAVVGKGAAGVAARWPKGLNRGPVPAAPVRDLDARFYPTSAGGQIASLGVFTGRANWIVEGTVSRQLIRQRERDHWIPIGAFAAGALALSLAASAILASRITRPLDTAIRAARSIGNGELNTPIPRSGPPEVVDLGIALGQLSRRIDHLLTSERDRAAELSHRLRTPLTVLALEVERLEPTMHDQPDDLRRVRRAIDDLERGLNDVIQAFQQARDGAPKDQSDAVAIVGLHLAYWRPLAQAQGRRVTASLHPAPLPVPLPESDLGAAIDAIIGNVFRHTPPGTGYEVSVRQADDTVVIVVRNGAPGADQPPQATASTGVGLRLTRSAIENVGGTLTITRVRDQGLAVTITLRSLVSPADRRAKPPRSTGANAF